MKLLLIFLIYDLTLALFSNDPCGRNESIDIHIIGFFPCTDPNDTRGIPVDNCDGIERIPIMKLALEEINGRCDLLPGYRLVVDYANSACQSIPALYHLIQQTNPSQPTKLMILGPACSEANIILGEVAERLMNIFQVSYTASYQLFTSDKQSYPRFVRIVPSLRQFADQNIAVINELKWKRVAVIAHASEIMLDLANYTEHRLKESEVTVLVNQNFADDDPSIVLEQLKRVNARIIITYLPPSSTSIFRRFWCTVVKSHLIGPEFVWLLPGWYQPGWWNATDINCPAEDMRNSLEHALTNSLDPLIGTNISRVIESGKNISQFQSDLAAIEETSGSVKTDSLLGIYHVYDAVWTIALALNSSMSILEERGLGRLEDFTYDSVEMADVFTEAVLNISFAGVSETISFQSSGDRSSYPIRVMQYRGGERTPILIHDSVKGFHYLPGQSLNWQGGETPRDGPVPVVLTSTLTEYIIAGVVSSIGILSTIYFFAFNFYYSRHLVVKRSSYRLNSLILVGVFIGFIGTVLHVIQLDSDMPEAFTTTVCNARVWMTNLTFVLAFGTLFAKVWRLYKVFFNKKMVKRKYLHDRHLFVIVVVIVAPTLVTLIVQVATFPLTLHTVATVNEDDFSTEEIYSECKGTHEFVFLSFIYAGEIILALVSVIVAFQTQKHSPKQDKYRKYHESAVINLTTIFALLLSSICQTVLIIFRLNNIQEGLLLIVTLRDCVWMYPMIYLLFVPKVYRVYSGLYSGKIQLPQQVSAVGTLFPERVRSSLSSGAGTKSSFISTSELVSSRRESSDAGIGSVDGANNRQDEGDTKLVPLNVTNKEALFSPILEHHEEYFLKEINPPNSVDLTVCLASNTVNAALELHESNET